MLTTNLETKNHLIKYQNFNPSHTEEQKKIEEVLAILGLRLSDSQLNCLCDKKLLSLENLNLADLGTLFLLANAINYQKFKQKTSCFRDLLFSDDTSNSLGIPLYCWEDENSSTKTYLRLTFLTGSPAIILQKQSN